MKDLNDWAKVHELYKKGYKKKRIADELGMSRNTVKKLLRLKEAPKYTRRSYSRKLDPYHDQIYKWYFEQDLIVTRIQEELEKLECKVSLNTIYRYIDRLEKSEIDDDCISCNATCGVETPPGDQAQFDWSEYRNVPVGNRSLTVYCFSMILAATRKKAVVFSLKEDASAIYDAIQDLFTKLGGVTLELLIDNPKALVIENTTPKCPEEIQYNPHAMLLAMHLGTELNACPYYWPRKKGKIERPFNYIEEHFIKGNTFFSMEDLNERGDQFITDWNSNKPNTTTQRIPELFYQEVEKDALQELPEDRWRMDELFQKKYQRTVSNECLISYDGYKYSVPAKYVGNKKKSGVVYVYLAYGFRLEIYDPKDRKLICTWEHKKDKKVNVNNNHVEPVTPTTSSSLPQIRRDFKAAFPHGEKYLEAADKAGVHEPARNAREILKLKEVYPVEVLDLFIAYGIEHNRLLAKQVKELLKNHYMEIVYPGVDIQNLKPGIGASASCNQENGTDEEIPPEQVPESSGRDCGYYDA